MIPLDFKTNTSEFTLGVNGERRALFFDLLVVDFLNFIPQT